MNIVFVSHCDFRGNSAMHLFSICNGLAALGVSSLVCVPGDPATVARHGEPSFRVTGYDGAVQAAGRFTDGRGPDLVHAWTPREAVRKLAKTLAQRSGVPYLVHLEDNEELLLQDSLAGTPFAEVARLPAALQDQLVPESRYHPRHGPRFLAGAAGVTALMDRLLEAAPARVPSLVFWPGYDEAFDRPGADGGFRQSIGVPPTSSLLAYTGNVHASNLGEVSSLVLAVHALRRRGHAVTLVKTGTDFVPVPLYDEGVRQGFIVDLGFLPRSDVPRLVHDADVLVQPGRPGRFNDYRFPSKLPEFLVSGRPVVLPATNIGRFLRDGVECVLLHEGHALEIAARVEPLLGDAGLCARIGTAGREFARRELRWTRAAAALKELYDEIATARRAPAGTATPGAVEARASADVGADAAGRSAWPVRLVAVRGPAALPGTGSDLEARSYGIAGSSVLLRAGGEAAEGFADDVLSALAGPAGHSVAGAPVVLVDEADRLPPGVVARWREHWAAHGLPAVHLVAYRPGRVYETPPAGFDAVAARLPEGPPPAHVLYPLVALPAGGTGERRPAGGGTPREYEAALRRAVSFAMTRARVQAPLVFLEAPRVASAAGAQGAPPATGAAGAGGPSAPPHSPWTGAVLVATRHAWSGGMQAYYARRGLPLTEEMMVDALVAAEAVPPRGRAAGRTSGGFDAAR